MDPNSLSACLTACAAPAGNLAPYIVAGLTTLFNVGHMWLRGKGVSVRSALAGLLVPQMQVQTLPVASAAAAAQLAFQPHATTTETK